MAYKIYRTLDTAIDIEAAIANSVAPNSVALGTNTAGNYMNNVSPGSGISISSTPGEGFSPTVSHADTSSQASVNNSGRTYIQDVTLDEFGHVTAIASATETVTDTNTVTTVKGTGGTAVSGEVLVQGTGLITTSQSGQTITVATTATNNTGTVTSVAVTAGNGLTGGGTVTASGTINLDIGAGTGISVAADSISVSYGTAAGTACQGNDARLSDARTPLTHTHNYAGSASAGGSAYGSAELEKNATFNSTGQAHVQYYDSDFSGQVTTYASNDWNAPTNAWYQLLHMPLSVTGYFNDIAIPVNDTGGIYWRQRRNTSYYGWYRLLDSNNFNSYAPKLDGTGATGTWGIGISGNAATATTATKWATARTLSITGDVTGSVSVDGSGDASITATVADDSHNHIISNVDNLQTALDAKLSLSGGTLTGNVTLSNAAPILTVSNSGGTDAAIILDRGANANWKLMDTGGVLKFQCDYSGSKVAYYDVLNLNHTTGNASLLGSFTAPTFIGALTGNAATATKLATARTIAGTSFDGSANINISYNSLTDKPTIPPGAVVNDTLTSTSTSESLSANQGRVLNNKFIYAASEPTVQLQGDAWMEILA